MTTVSRAAARMASYWYECINPAFGFTKEHLSDNEVYLEVPNSHSTIFCQDYAFPSPLTKRECMFKIV